VAQQFAGHKPSSSQQTKVSVYQADTTILILLKHNIT
jgi:hypothetical protein